MTCIIVLCLLIAGSDRACDTSKPAIAYYIVAPKVIGSWEECRRTYRSMALGPGVRKTRFEFAYTTNDALRGR
jgi:hypothetical protein